MSQRVMRRLNLRTSVARICSLSLLLVACRVERTPGADSGQAAPTGDSGGRPVAATPGAQARSGEIPADFARRADSVLARRLALSLWDAESASEPATGEIDMVDGDRPAFVAARARVLHDSARAAVERDRGSSVVVGTFRVEVTSVASLYQVDDAGGTREFDVTVRPRTDTAEMRVSLHATSVWSVGDPLRYRKGGGPVEPWSFARAKDTLITLVKWSPSRANRDTLMQLVQAARAVP